MQRLKSKISVKMGEEGKGGGEGGRGRGEGKGGGELGEHSTDLRA